MSQEAGRQDVAPSRPRGRSPARSTALRAGSSAVTRRPRRSGRRFRTYKKTLVDARMLCRNPNSPRNYSSPDQPSSKGERQWASNSLQATLASGSRPRRLTRRIRSLTRPGLRPELMRLALYGYRRGDRPVGGPQRPMSRGTPAREARPLRWYPQCDKRPLHPTHTMGTANDW